MNTVCRKLTPGNNQRLANTVKSIALFTNTYKNVVVEVCVRVLEFSSLSKLCSPARRAAITSRGHLTSIHCSADFIKRLVRLKIRACTHH